jgi:glycosyltransferase involved in cell wall biosynthesis
MPWHLGGLDLQPLRKSMHITAFPIMIKVWAGADAHDFQYIRRSLPSLLKSDLPAEARVILINDCSPDPRLQGYLECLAAAHANVEVWLNPKRLGPNEGQQYNFPKIVERFPNAPFYVLCDDDIIYHPGWLQRLIQVHDEARAVMLNGVFTALNVPAKPSYSSRKLPTSDVVLKERQMALNWLVPADVYKTVGPFRVNGSLAYDHDYGLRLAALGFPVICLSPSYVQNIGYKGAYQQDDTLTARDYVGRLDWYLRLRDFRYALKRHTIGRVRSLVERMPNDNMIKRMLVRAVRPIRSWVDSA